MDSKKENIILQSNGLNIWGAQICSIPINKLELKMETETFLPTLCYGYLYGTSPLKEILYLSDEDQYVKIYDGKKPFFKNTNLIKLDDKEFCSGTFITSNTVCCCRYNNLLKQYETLRLVFSKKNIDDQDLKNVLHTNKFVTRSMFCNQNSLTLFTGNINGDVYHFNLFNKDQESINCKSTIYSIKSQDANKKIIFGTLSGQLISLDAEKMQPDVISELKSPLYSVCYDSTNHLIMFGGQDGILSFIDDKTKKKAHDSFSTNFQIGSTYGSSLIYLPEKYQLIVGNYKCPSYYCSRLVFFDLRKFQIIASHNLRDDNNGRLLSLDLF